MSDDFRAAASWPDRTAAPIVIRLLIAGQDAEWAARRCEQCAVFGNGSIVASPTCTSATADCVARTTPDVLLLECASGDIEGTGTLLAQLAPATARTRVVVLWHAHSVETLVLAVRHGASGWLNASSTPATYADAVVSVHAGHAWFGRRELLEAVRWLLPARGIRASLPGAVGDADRLTQREQEVLACIGAGLSNKEIGRRLGISDKTVKTHLHHVYVKLDRSGRYKAFVARDDREPHRP
jgi:DNA-binding NarL/FixJ family response regulator